MPQLWTETIVTQYFWLIVILFGFYYLAVTIFIPQIAYTLKARRILEASSLSGQAGQDNLDSASSSSNPLLTNTQNLLSSILTPKVTPSATTSANQNTNAFSSKIDAVRANWIQKNS